MLNGSVLDFILDDEDECIPYKLRGVGTGHSRTGHRRRWKKKFYFEEDLMAKFSSESTLSEFKARFAGYSPNQLNWFFDTFKKQLIRPRETEQHAKNKLLLWMDKLHNSLSGQEMRDKYQIGIKTAYSHVNDVLRAILKRYEDENVVRFPNIEERKQMVQILKTKGAPMPDAIFALDGSHARCTGRHIAERRSFKYRWLPCFNVLFVTDRVLNTVCAFSLDPRAAKHDITILREAWFYEHIDQILDGWVILADKGKLSLFCSLK